MSQNHNDSPHPETNPPGSFCESPMMSHQRAQTPKPSGGPGEVEGGIEDTARPARPGESVGSRVEAMESGGPVDVVGSGTEEKSENVIGEYKRMEDRIAELESEIGKTHGFYQGVVRGQTQHIRAIEERLKLTEELLETRSAELSGAQAFLSTTDRLSEVEVLSIVRDLNENIYQVAVNLTDEWESSWATSGMNIDPASQPTVVKRVLDRDPTGLTFLLQSCLCSQVAKMTSRWGHYRGLAILELIYQRLSVSEGQAISARWRSLTHSYLSLPPLHSASLVERLAKVLDSTGSFSSARQSLEFVRVVVLEGIETIIKLSLRLELAFKVEVASKDMSLLFEAPGTTFNDARMIDEFGPDGGSTPGRRDRIAGTTEVGVGKSICGRAGESRRTEILLKTKVVLEKDIIES